MGDDPTTRSSKSETAFARLVAAKAARKLSVRGGERQGVWFGLGMSGLVGWSVAMPTLLGAMLGLWWDRRHPGAHSWTLTLLVVGLAIGCVNAWHWILREDRAMHDEPENRDG
jgi:ATP synthase protein I